MIASFELDFFVPSFPVLSSFFHLSTEAVARLVSINIIGLTMGNFIFGPISDIFGRRKMLVIGLATFTISSFFCGLSPTYDTLLFSRFFQGFGASSGIILVSSIIMDVHKENEANSWLSFFNGLITASMAGAPIVGNLLLPIWGWRGNFYFISTGGCLSCILVYFFCPETKPKHATISFPLNKLLTSCKEQIKNRKFLQLASVPALFYSALIVYITFLPSILIDYLHISQKYYGWYHGLIMLAFCLASLFASYSQSRAPLNSVFTTGSFLISIAMLTFIFIGIKFFTIHSFFITSVMVIFMCGLAFCFSKYIVDALAIFPCERGTTLATIGGIKLLITALSVEFASQLSKVAPQGVFLSMGLVILLGLKFHWNIYVSTKR